MTTQTVSTIFSLITSSVSSILVFGLPYILGILGSLIGLGFLIRYFKNHIGGYEDVMGTRWKTKKERDYYNNHY